MKKVIAIILASFVLNACGETNQSVNLPEDFNSEAIISHKNNLQKILTKEMIAQLAGVPLVQIKMQVESKTNAQGQYTVLYSWPSGKTKKVAEGKHEILEYFSLSIGFIQSMTQEEFEQYHSTNSGIQQQVDMLTKQENFNKEIGTVEAKYLAEYAGRRKAEKLQNIATMAFWETPMNALHVLAKDAAFTLTANFGADEQLAKQKTIELAQTILNN